MVYKWLPGLNILLGQIFPALWLCLSGKYKCLESSSLCPAHHLFCVRKGCEWRVCPVGLEPGQSWQLKGQLGLLIYITGKSFSGWSTHPGALHILILFLSKVKQWAVTLAGSNHDREFDYNNALYIPRAPNSSPGLQPAMFAGVWSSWPRTGSGCCALIPLGSVLGHPSCVTPQCPEDFPPLWHNRISCSLLPYHAQL